MSLEPRPNFFGIVKIDSTLWNLCWDVNFFSKIFVDLEI